MKLEEIKKEAQERFDRANAEAKAAKDLLKAIEGYEKLEQIGILPEKPEGS